ncbi:MAG: hypothetical protein SGI77_01490 [Pirellulaceae bacterium]|nr:hypothetical protein [Pirellulaceae bacterium]
MTQYAETAAAISRWAPASVGLVPTEAKAFIHVRPTHLFTNDASDPSTVK